MVVRPADRARRSGASPGSGGVLFTPWLAGERSPIDDRGARAGFHNLSLRTTRAEMVRVRAGGSGLQLPLAGRGGRAVHRSAGSVRSGPSGAGPPRPCGARSSPTSSTGPSSRSADPMHANLRGSALLAGSGPRARSRRMRSVAGAGDGHPPTRSGVASSATTGCSPNSRPSTAPRRACSSDSIGDGERRGRPGAGEHRLPDDKGVGRSRPGQQESLCLVAPHGSDGGQLGFGLDTLGHHRNPSLWARSTTAATMVGSCSGEPSPATKLRSTFRRSMGSPCRYSSDE